MFWIIVVLLGYIVMKEVFGFFDRRDCRKERDRLTDKIMAKNYTEFRLGKNIQEAVKQKPDNIKPSKADEDERQYDDEHLGGDF